eukprot:TRINITY_DN3567_c0_g6_i1.p1 TRINITY_DN3567_c0_g6~~TRINITY_DN3567_c0_g6_i1.p1  ORF type:complete len:499 (-),score=115.22 TRINITY_DN3567_c0_g6_i1:168-1664(-)
MVRITEVETATPTLFEEKLSQILSVMPDEESRESLKKGLIKYWERPPITEMELVLGKRLVLEEIRQMLFFPGEEFGPNYVLLLGRPPEDALEDHPMIKVLVPSLSLFYLSHVKDWSFVRSFILANGLFSLVDLLVVSNLYLRSQAVDIFMQITNVEMYDWFAPHTDPKSDLYVNKKMLELSRSEIVKNLLSNSRVAFPNGSFYCLQLFAFFASWIRLHYCPGNVLPLSKSILGQLKEWSERTDLHQEETDLAKNLYNDFSQTPGLDDKDFHQSMTERVESKSDRSLARERAEALRKEGNSFFSKGDMNKAIQLYSESLQLHSTNADTFSNRAAAKLKLAQSEGDATKKSKLLGEVIYDCNQAIGISNQTVKAYFRKAKALIELQRNTDALAVVEEGLQHNKGQSDLISLQRSLRPSEQPSMSSTTPNTKPKPEHTAEGKPPASTFATENAPSIAKSSRAGSFADEASPKDQEIDPIQRYLNKQQGQQGLKKKPLIEEL